MSTGTTVARLFAEQLALPEDYDAVVTWLPTMPGPSAAW